MDKRTAHFLRRVNNSFYASCASSFSATRSSAWAGWQRCLPYVQQAASRRMSLRILDVACGNMRFEKFLAQAVPQVSFDFHAVDDCVALAGDAPGVQFQNLDILSALEDGTLAASLGACEPEEVACFGFMHHVPGFEARCAMLRALVESAASGACIFVSFWRFMENARLAAKASASWPGEDAGFHLQLEKGDYFLGWQNEAGLVRYCHHFDEEELAKLAEAACDAGAQLLEAFDADGKSGNLNRYFVLRKL